MDEQTTKLFARFPACAYLMPNLDGCWYIFESGRDVGDFTPIGTPDPSIVKALESAFAAGLGQDPSKFPV